METRLTDVLSPFGYHWFQITSEVPYPERDRIVGDRTYEHLMWLFAPDLPDERFWAAVRSRTAELAHCTVERAAGLHAQAPPRAEGPPPAPATCQADVPSSPSVGLLHMGGQRTGPRREWSSTANRVRRGGPG